MAVEFPERVIPAVHEMTTRRLELRKAGTPLDKLARALLGGFVELCTYAGLDRVLDELGAEAGELADDEARIAAVVARLEAIELDGGGPRSAKPRQVADCLLGALDLAVVAEPDRGLALGDDVRAACAAAIARTLDAALAPAVLREAIVADARARCDEAHAGTFTKVAAQLDAAGLHLVKEPKVPLEAFQAVQRALHDARRAVIARAAGSAIDRVAEILAPASAEAAARLDAPVSRRATVRAAAIARVCDAQLPKTPTAVAHALLESLTALAQLAWQAPVEIAQAYAASKTFAVGDVIAHPKFGRGKVVGGLANRIDVEFEGGKYTLVHVPPRR